MWTFTATTLIDAPVEQVWLVLADVLHWPQWLPTVTSVEALGPPNMVVGANYRIVQPKLRPAVWSVVELEPPSRFSWESRSPGVRTVADHVVNAVTPDSTSLFLQVSLHGPLAGLAALVAGRLTHRYLEREAASLKHRAEAELFALLEPTA